ncbi:hypothetical protein BT69DRAFT_1280881, partial [Atractiella rhizophila]
PLWSSPHPASPRPSSGFHLLLRTPSGTLLLTPALHTSCRLERFFCRHAPPYCHLSRSSK